MPLVLCNFGERLIIKKIGGSPEVKQHLNELGFNVGSELIIISDISGNLIVKIKNSRIAINKKMAAKIIV